MVFTEIIFKSQFVMIQILFCNFYLQMYLLIWIFIWYITLFILTTCYKSQLLIFCKAWLKCLFFCRFILFLLFFLCSLCVCFVWSGGITGSGSSSGFLKALSFSGGNDVKNELDTSPSQGSITHNQSGNALDASAPDLNKVNETFNQVKPFWWTVLLLGKSSFYEKNSCGIWSV